MLLQLPLKLIHQLCMLFIPIILRCPLRRFLQQHSCHLLLIQFPTHKPLLPRLLYLKFLPNIILLLHLPHLIPQIASLHPQMLPLLISLLQLKPQLIISIPKLLLINFRIHTALLKRLLGQFCLHPLLSSIPHEGIPTLAPFHY